VASKAVNHKLKGTFNSLTACLSVRDNPKFYSSNQNQNTYITTDIMCIIEHLGFRLTAMPLLPLKKMLYGVTLRLPF